MSYSTFKNLKQIKIVDMKNLDKNTIAIENVVKMDRLDQYADKVINYTSRFNCNNIGSYAPENITGRNVVYPSYGDFPDAYFLRSYGKWWVERDAYQQEYMPQDVDSLLAEDYITLGFETSVIPRDVCIYEVYNPGAIIRIWGRKICGDRPWVLLWEGQPQVGPDLSRKFHPKIKLINDMINVIRLEFNQSKLRYYTSIDAVVLGGFARKNGILNNVLKCQITGKSDDLNSVVDLNEQINPYIEKEDCFLNLPCEVIIHIFQYLDLISLSKCAQVNKRWNEIVNDPVLYQNLSLKRYWSIVDGSTLDYFFNKCSGLRKLDLSWCGNEDAEFASKFKTILLHSQNTLTHLSLGNCDYVNNDLIFYISVCTELVDLRLKNTLNWRISTLDNLNKLGAIDLTCSLIQDNDLIKILKANPGLRHVIIDLCEDLRRLDQVIAVAAQYNKKLETWSCWKTPFLTHEGAGYFGYLENLKDLDLGWCLLTVDPVESLMKIAKGCRKLRRLVLSEWRGVNDQLLMPIIEHCKDLYQLDLTGIRGVSAELCERALVGLPKLRLLDISFCVGIHQSQVSIWREQYPHITIQRSCQYVVNDFWMS